MNENQHSGSTTTKNNLVFIGVVLALVAIAFGLYFYTDHLNRQKAEQIRKERLANARIDDLVRAAVNPKGFKEISRADAFKRLQTIKIDSTTTVPESAIPIFNFCLYGYSARYPQNNARALQVAQLLIDRGANINAPDGKTGRPPLHEAILYNQVKLVKFLIKNNANPMIKINHAKSKFHNHNALEIAKKIDLMDKNIDYSQVIKLVEDYQKQYLAKSDQKANASK